jgi:hypothetical protein
MRGRVEWINLAQDRDKWMGAWNTDINHRVPNYTAMPPYQLIQYPWFQLSIFYRGSKKWKIKEINGS